MEISSPARHWREPTIPGGSRYQFLVSSPGSSSLEVSHVASSDAGLYRCRVDYEHHQTVIWWSRLTVVGEENLEILILSSFYSP